MTLKEPETCACVNERVSEPVSGSCHTSRHIWTYIYITLSAHAPSDCAK